MRLGLLLALSVVPSMSACGLMAQLSESETECDPVTGQSVINKYTLDQEIEEGRSLESQFIEREKRDGCTVDQDPDAIQRVKRVLSTIIQVCHLPRLPWRFHVSSRPVFNAFATFGGLIFVFKGLLNEVSDDELGAVLGHEVAHVTCRHLTENLSHGEMAGAFSKSAHSGYYKASFSTEQEAEADRVGILYMSLAGFDPRQAWKIWQRMHEKVGSSPKDYLYTHPLNLDRAEQTKKSGSIAHQYFAGDGIVNPKWGEVLADNELAPRQNRPDDPNAAFLSAALNSYVLHQETKAEAKRREGAAAQKNRRAEALNYIRVENVKYGNTSDGHRGVFADVSNGSNVLMKSVVLEIRYLDGANQIVHRESIRVDGLRSGERRNAGFYLKRVAYKNISVAVIDADY